MSQNDFVTTISSIIEANDASTQQQSSIIFDLIQDITKEVESTSQNVAPTFTEDEFMKQISSSECSSSSTNSSSSSESDNENKPAKIKKVKKVKKVKVKAILAARIEDNDEDEDDDDEDQPRNKTHNPAQINFPKTKGEITIDQLLNIESLNIELEESEKLTRIGRITSTVMLGEGKQSLVVQSVLDEASGKCIALNEDTILFDVKRVALGKIVETFGPVSQPFYLIQLDKTLEATSPSLEKGNLVFYAPNSKKYTKFIFNIDELRKMKGSDASWNNDNEPPVECVDYSDDEQEKLAKQKLKLKKQQRQGRKPGSSIGEADGDESGGSSSTDESDLVTTSKEHHRIPSNSQPFVGHNNKRPFMRKSNSTRDGFQSSSSSNNAGFGPPHQQNQNSMSSSQSMHQGFNNVFMPPSQFQNSQMMQQPPPFYYPNNPNNNQPSSLMGFCPPNLQQNPPSQFNFHNNNNNNPFNPHFNNNYSHFNAAPPQNNPRFTQQQQPFQFYPNQQQQQQQQNPQFYTNQQNQRFNQPMFPPNQNFNYNNNNGYFPNQPSMSTPPPQTASFTPTPPNIVDKRFVQNSNIIKKTF